MNKEIKEILEELRNKDNLKNKSIVITCEYCDWFGTCPHSYKEYDYKQRIDKAINRISLMRMDDITIETHKALNEILNILNGSDEK